MPYCGCVLWGLIDQGYFGHYDKDDHDQVDIGMTDSMRAFFKANGTPTNDRQRTMKVSNCGTRDSPLLKLKAGKMRNVLPWILSLIKDKGGRQLLGDTGPVANHGTQLQEVGEGFENWFAILRSQPREMDDLAKVHIEQFIKKTVSAWQDAGGQATMKWHVFGRHMREQMDWSGNPSFTHNYADESENFSQRKLASFVNRTKFSEGAAVRWVLGDLFRDLQLEMDS